MKNITTALNVQGRGATISDPDPFHHYCPMVQRKLL